MSVLVIIYAIAGAGALFITAPICFVLFTRALLLLVAGKGVEQLRMTMRCIGLLCLPAFIAMLMDIAISFLHFFQSGADAVVAAYQAESFFFWVPFCGAALSFVLYMVDVFFRRRGGGFGNLYYIMWFLFFLVACYAMMIAWIFLPARG